MDCLALVRAHLDKVTTLGLDVYGKTPTAMWMAGLDTRTGRYPENDARPAHIPKRVYRNIDAPRGCSLYWDQPAVVAAHELSRITGEARYRDAADAYVRDFLARCVAGNGVFLWGNHYYYDAFADTVKRFLSDDEPAPVDFATEDGALHEIRPLTPAWETFWRVDPATTETAIRAAVKGHLVDKETGEFQRHAAGNRGCAFLEAGGILAESLAWLYTKTGDRSLLDTAAKMIGYSFSHRDDATGLPENNPTEDRWDKYTATSEVGLWAGCLLRAAARADVDDWRARAVDALRAWLTHAYDAESRRYYGRLRIGDGSPVLEPKTTPYQPGDWCDFWAPLFPAHDYPFQAAEACLLAFDATRDGFFLAGAARFAKALEDSLPARSGRGGYAEHYGRALHLALRLHTTTGDTCYAGLAARVAEEATTVLWAQDMFRSHPAEDRCDAVDDIGFLLLALMRMESGEEPAMMGSGW